MGEELVGQIELCGRILGHHQKAGGVFVDAVYQYAHPFVFHVGGEGEVIGEGVHQRSVVISVAGMHYHAGCFVHDQYVVVFVNDVQGNVFRKNLCPAALVGHHEFHHIQRTHDVIGLHGLVVYQHIAQFDGLLHPVTRSVLLVGSDEFIHAKRFLTLVHKDPEMLEHEIFFARHSAGSFAVSSVRYRFTEVPRGFFSPRASCLYTTAFTESA